MTRDSLLWLKPASRALPAAAPQPPRIPIVRVTETELPDTVDHALPP